MSIQTSSVSGSYQNFGLIKILFLITIIILPVTMCYSIRPIWFNPSSPSSSSTLSLPSDSTAILDSSLNDFIATAKLLQDTIAVNDQQSTSNSETQLLSSSSDVDSNRNNLVGNVITLPRDFDLQNIDANLLHVRPQPPPPQPSPPSSSVHPDKKGLKRQQNMANNNSKLKGDGQDQTLLLPPWTFEPEIIATALEEAGKGDEKRLSKRRERDEKRYESRVKKALSLFAHWKPTYKQHLDDAYSSELVSAVSRGHGRTVGQALRWG